MGLRPWRTTRLAAPVKPLTWHACRPVLLQLAERLLSCAHLCACHACAEGMAEGMWEDPIKEVGTDLHPDPKRRRTVEHVPSSSNGGSRAAPHLCLASLSRCFETVRAARQRSQGSPLLYACRPSGPPGWRAGG